MDPLSASSVAACVIQVVDFGSKIVANGSEIYKSASGSSIDNTELQKTTKDLEDLTLELEKSLQSDPSSAGLGSDEEAERQLGRECKAVAMELLAVLDRLKRGGQFSKWRSYRQAFLSVWRKEQIDSLEKRLDRFRQQLVMRLLTALRIQVREMHKRGTIPGVTSRGNDASLCAVFLEHVKDSARWQREISQVLLTGTGSIAPQRTPDASKKRTEDLQHKLLASIRYPQIQDRKQRIAKAVRNTFEWIYRPPDPALRPWADFAIWLEHERGVYWIYGKPGSGKSTLMKFLYGDPRTHQLLQNWARNIRTSQSMSPKNSSLIIGSFFFWNSGVEMQMSYEGFLRAMLHQISIADPDIIFKLFSERLEALDLLNEMQPWTLTELLAAFRRLCLPDFQSRQFFFFVDGLDEFSGNHREIIDLIKDMAVSSHIKFCVSSRLWNVFQDAFGTIPNLRLQDLTIGDIETFVSAKFHENTPFVELENLDPLLAKTLCLQVARKANGVFLWVRLVVESLLEGLSNGDRVKDLHRRLEELPQDLEGLFKKILKNIGEESRAHLAHASELFQISRRCYPITILTLSYADEDDGSILSEKEPRLLTEQEIRWRIESMRRRLNSRTKGLLEVEDWSTDPKMAVSLLQTFRTEDVAFQKRYNVQYIHRTVKEFFEKPDNWSLIQQAGEPSFDPKVSLVKAYVLEVKHFDVSSFGPHDIRKYVVRAMETAALVSPDRTPLLLGLLDHLNLIVEILAERPNLGRGRLYPKPPLPFAMLLPVAMSFKLDFWVKARFRRDVAQSSPKVNKNLKRWFVRHYDQHVSALEKLFKGFKGEAALDNHHSPMLKRKKMERTENNAVKRICSEQA
ncbi:hypothetical protein BDV96DRAFT_643182 [Lophiotrema nucula]|uniref:NACHT domain-containing protein n=1 Tax=Lophiotrema nucula TaxID=690887 RepID=A0A6A5ZID7_9PLEO|nr:hypothetical protein BDV96DRAFT_643182 [Lophiotrema nucula]